MKLSGQQDSRFKVQHEEDDGIWSDVSDSEGRTLEFASIEAARARLAEQFALVTHLEKYGGKKRTRVVRIYRSDEEWDSGRADEQTRPGGAQG